MLIVEDGTGVEFANSYQSLTDARDLAAKIGVTLPDDNTEAEQALINGGLYLQKYEPELCGTRTTDIQGLMFPSTGASIRCNEIGENDIPNDLKVAQLIAAQDFANGGNAWGTQDTGQSIAAHSVDGAVSQSYFNTNNTSNDYSIPRVDSIMEAFCGVNGDSVQYWVRTV